MRFSPDSFLDLRCSTPSEAANSLLAKPSYKCRIGDAGAEGIVREQLHKLVNRAVTSTKWINTFASVSVGFTQSEAPPLRSAFLEI